MNVCVWHHFPTPSKAAPMSATFAPTAPSRLAPRIDGGRRARLIRLVVVSFVAVVGAIVLSTRFADADTSSPTTGPNDGLSAAVVVVQPGDTLWSVARALQPSGDVRPLVARLSRDNGGSSVKAGDRLRVPSALLSASLVTP
jgi:LysM repeat protein